MGTPTPEEIAAVQKNIDNLIDLTNFIHDYAQDKINNAYLLQSQDPDQDPGQAWIDIILGGSIWVLGDFGFPGANFAAGILSGIFTYYTTQTPPSLKGTFAGVWQRFDATFIQANLDLTAIHDDVAGHWNDTYKAVDGNDYTVSSLASAQVPAKDNNEFVQMAQKALTAFDVDLWKSTLGVKWNIWITSQDPTLFPEQQSWDWRGWSKGFVDVHPAYRVVAQWYDSHGKNCCSETKGWNIWEYWLGANANPFSDAAAPESLCDYLFQDDGGGNIVRPGSLATRADVFTNWGLPNKTLYIANYTPPVLASTDNRPGKTIQEFLEDHSRQDLEARVQKKAAEDPEFYYELVRRPRETLYKFLGLKIPDIVNITVHPERHDQFHLVLPKIGGPR